MPLYLCSRCGALENTALGDFWSRMDTPLCSECSRGKWHGAFAKKFPKKSEYQTEKGTKFISLRTDNY